MFFSLHYTDYCSYSESSNAVQRRREVTTQSSEVEKKGFQIFRLTVFYLSFVFTTNVTFCFHVTDVK